MIGVVWKRRRWGQTSATPGPVFNYHSKYLTLYSPPDLEKNKTKNTPYAVNFEKAISINTREHNHIVTS